MRSHSTNVGPTDLYMENVRRTPISHSRTVRSDDVATVTTSVAGKFVPISMIPLLREDGVMSSTLNVNFQMAETTNMLLNPVRASAVAYLVPKLALDRFKDQGTIDRSYNGQPEVDGNVVPWFEMFQGASPNELTQTLGLHSQSEGYNTDYIESYNQVWNYIARQRSAELDPRDRLDTTLAPAFWEHNQMRHMKATFDDALLEGEIPLTITDQTVPVVYQNDALNPVIMRNIESANAPAAQSETIYTNNTSGLRNNIPGAQHNLAFDPNGTLFAELADSGVTVSLANIQLARETAAWARLRTQYQGLSEEWMMDQLLAGIRMPYEQLKHPILLDHSDTVFGMQQRYATDSGNLDKSATEGQTSLSLRLNVPAISTGGVIVVCAQALPEQIFERQKDYYLSAKTVGELPDRTSDELDPQPVSLVRNDEIDTQHSAGGDLFAYAPLNHQWKRNAPRLGGKFYRADPNAPWTEDRNRVWDTSVVDPQLGTDFYVASTITQDVFADTTADNFEYWVGGRVNISGLTYFGPALRESQDDYEKVLAQVDQTRIEGDGSDVPSAAAAASADE